ncbi:MAG: flippase-like domain-containing protein, partial [Gammaproteobacteria bacterium]|nr:flippase-like domain-containing protein [Gammaproteobacteria bacterium]
LALGLIAWILNGLVFYLILLKVGFPLSITIALTIYAISILAGAASFIPGGIGATETVMGLMLIAANSEPHIAIAVPILSRLATLWFAVCVGLLANTYLSVNNDHPDSINNNNIKV